MKTNKEQLMEIYGARLEAKLPGASVKGLEIVSRYWDAKSDLMLEKEMLMRHGMPDSVVFGVLRDLATRFPTMNEEIKALRS